MQLVHNLEKLAGMSVALVLAIGLAMMVWTQPVADDFCRASANDWLGYTYNAYLRWTGRWAGMAIDTLVLPRMELTDHYSFVMVLMWCILALMLYAFVQMFLQEAATAGVTLGWALGLIAMYWVGMPAPGETVYWFTGNVEYQLPLAMGIAAVWLLWRAGKEGSRHLLRRGVEGFGLLLCVFVTGLHELAALVMTVVVAAGAFVSLRRGTGRTVWILALMMVLVGFAVSVLAPGNAVRASADFPNSFSLSNLPLALLQNVRSVLIPWFIAPHLLLGTILLVLHPGFCSLRPGWLDKGNADLWRWLVPAVWIVSLSGVVIAIALSTGFVGPPRAQNFEYGIFLVGWFATLFVWTRPQSSIAGDTAASRAGSPVIITLAAQVLFVAALTDTPSVSSSVKSLVRLNDTASWRDAMTERYQLTEAAVKSGATEVVLPRPPPKPAMYFQSDIESDPTHWSNQCYSNYFGIDSARLVAK